MVRSMRRYTINKRTWMETYERIRRGERQRIHNNQEPLRRRHPGVRREVETLRELEAEVHDPADASFPETERRGVASTSQVVDAEMGTFTNVVDFERGKLM